MKSHCDEDVLLSASLEKPECLPVMLTFSPPTRKRSTAAMLTLMLRQSSCRTSLIEAPGRSATWLQEPSGSVTLQCLDERSHALTEWRWSDWKKQEGQTHRQLVGPFGGQLMNQSRPWLCCTTFSHPQHLRFCRRRSLKIGWIFASFCTHMQTSSNFAFCVEDTDSARVFEM